MRVKHMWKGISEEWGKRVWNRDLCFLTCKRSGAKEAKAAWLKIQRGPPTQGETHTAEATCRQPICFQMTNSESYHSAEKLSSSHASSGIRGSRDRSSDDRWHGRHGARHRRKTCFSKYGHWHEGGWWMGSVVASVPTCFRQTFQWLLKCACHTQEPLRHHSATEPEHRVSCYRYRFQ